MAITSTGRGDAVLHEADPVSKVWPDWNGLGYDSVARYVNPAELEDAAIAPWVRFNDLDEDNPLEQLAEVFRYVQSLGIRYGLEPWISGEGQRIRWPALIRRDCGTCLDIAVLFASVLLRCQFRPLLVFAESTARTESHVVVLVDLRAPLQDLKLDSDSGQLPLLRDDDRGRYTYSFDDAGTPEGFVIFDATTATLGDGDFDDAVEAARKLINDPVRYPNKIVLDVASAIQGMGGEPYPIPNESTGASAVWTRLPPRYSPPPLPDSDELVARLHAAQGRLALIGESGTGKSTIAYRTAAGWDNGYGWFLNAADRSTFQAELAQVELMQRSRSLGASQEQDDQVALSRAALRRLNQSHLPWVVVVDNADNEPGSIADLLPVPRWSGQVVIITSTHSAWASWADTSLEFGRISPSGSRTGSSDAEPGVVPRRAIEVDIRGRLTKRGIKVNADDLSSLIELSKGHLSSATQQLAITISWAPATQVGARVFVQGTPLCAFRARLAELETLGLVGTTQSGGWTVAMHRSIAAEIRSWDPDTPSAGASRFRRLMENALLVEVLAERAEESVLVRLIQLVERSARRRSLVDPLFTLSEVLEARGMSQEAAEIANVCLGRDDGELTPYRAALAKLLVVRHTKNHARDVVSLQAALRSVAEVVEGLPKSAEREARLFYYQCVATEGLVRRQLAKLTLQGDRLANELESARSLILEAASRRAEIIGPDDWRSSIEREMALFGIAAVSLDLGKSRFSEPLKVASLLGDSLQMYTAVRDAVNEVHGHAAIHPRAAAAEYGRALCFYYSALLGIRPQIRSETQIFGIPAEYEAHAHIENPLPDHSEEADEPLLLAAAHEALLESLRGRAGLQVGNQDSADVVKSLRLGIEISATRIIWAPGNRSGAPVRRMSAREIEGLLTETEQNFRNDWRHFGGIATGDYSTDTDPEGRHAGYRRRWPPAEAYRS